MAQIWDQIDKIVKDLHTIKDTFETELPKKAEEDLLAAHKSIITEYYSQYSPSTYRRKPNGQNLMATLIKKKTKVGSSKIVVGSDGMGSHGRKGYKNGAITEDNVFDLMWNQGIRGLPRVGSENIVHGPTWDGWWMGHYHPEGQPWVNPFWSGEGDPWRNIYKARLLGVPAGTPDDVMYNYVDKWAEIEGEAHADKIADKIRSKL